MNTNQLEPGKLIDNRYKIIKKLGSGGFATVYQAQHLKLNKDIAIKVMTITSDDEEELENYIKRFTREAQIAARLQHPNVVTIYDYGRIEDTNQPYIAMELLEGHDLDYEIYKKSPLSPHRAFKLFRPVLDALGAGHNMGIVHKDLKPANLYMIDPGGPKEHLKVLDFGVARMENDECGKLTKTGQLIGTPRYFAPEYIKFQIVQPTVDVYQMALIISEALTGIQAVNSANSYDMIMRHSSGKLNIAHFLKKGPVGKVFRKALTRDYEKRYQNCIEFGKALDTIEEYFSSDVPLKDEDAKAITAKASSSSTKPSTQQPSAHPQVAFKTDRKWKIIALVLILVLAGLLTLVCILMLTKSANDNDKVAGESESSSSENQDTEAEETHPEDTPETEMAGTYDETEVSNANETGKASNSAEVKKWFRMLSSMEPEMAESKMMNRLHLPSAPSDTPEIQRLWKEADTGNDAIREELGLKYMKMPPLRSNVLNAFQALNSVQNHVNPEAVFVRAILEFNFSSWVLNDHEKMHEEALKHMQMASDMNYIPALEFTIDHDFGARSAKATEKLEAIYQKEAQEENPEAIYGLAQLIEKKCDALSDLEEAQQPDFYQLYEKAALLGSLAAEYALARLKIQQDPEIGYIMIKKLADTGFPQANAALAKLFMAARLDEADDLDEFGQSKIVLNYLDRKEEENVDSSPENVIKYIDYSDKFLGNSFPLMIRYYNNITKTEPHQTQERLYEAIHRAVVRYFAKQHYTRYCCDSFSDMFGITNGKVTQDITGQYSQADLKIIYDMIIECYYGALNTGNDYNNVLPDNSKIVSTSIILSKLYQGIESWNIPEQPDMYLGAIAFGALIGEGVAEFELATIYETGKFWKPNMERACYWSKAVAQSDLCNVCIKDDGSHFESCLSCHKNRTLLKKCTDENIGVE